jgi:hypothetical protein
MSFIQRIDVNFEWALDVVAIQTNVVQKREF